jgi:hypothetical protein
LDYTFSMLKIEMRTLCQNQANCPTNPDPVTPGLTFLLPLIDREAK